MPGQRQRDDVRQRASFVFGDAFGAGDGSPSGSEGVAGNDEVVGDGAALDVGFRASRAVGENFSFYEAISGGIEINKNGGGAVFFGGEGFEAAIAVGIGIAH
jgi:hypothetical protein